MQMEEYAAIQVKEYAKAVKLLGSALSKSIPARECVCVCLCVCVGARRGCQTARHIALAKSPAVCIVLCV
jgi:hypothetical protein